MSDYNPDIINPQYYKEEVFKHWHKYGFISVKYWPRANQVLIEIAQTNTDTKAVVSLSEAYIEGDKFLSYLRAETHKLVSHLYPDYPQQGFKNYGGTTKDGQPISRVFASNFWKIKGTDDPDYTARAFSCSLYKAKRNAQGAYQPIYSEQISHNTIKLSLEQISQMYISLSQVMQAFLVEKMKAYNIFSDQPSYQTNSYAD